jgi:hypothetical protein
MLGAIGMQMKKTQILILVTFLGFCSRAKTSTADSSGSISGNNMLEILHKGDFSDGSGIHFISLVFKGTEYEFTYRSEGWYWYNQGTFEIVGEKIRLKPTFCGSGPGEAQDCNATFNTGTCVFKEDSKNLEYRYDLICTSEKKFKIYTDYSPVNDTISFDVRQFPVQVGSEREYAGTKVIVLGNTKGEVIEDVILRNGPGTSFPSLEYIVNAYDGPRLKSLPKGRQPIIHARTATKHKVKNWENYWLLISIDDSRKVWAFGEFIKY